MKVMQRQRLECCSHKPSKARGHQKPEEARDRTFQEPLEGGRPCRQLDCEQRHFCCLKPPSLWSSVKQPGNHTRLDSPGPKMGRGSQRREQHGQPSHLTRAQGAWICLLAKLPALSLHFARKLPSCFFQFPLWVRKVIKTF